MSKRETWIVAVSGGVDSVVLLDMLVASAAANFVVAHVDHGIRSDSQEDAALVARVAEEYGLPYESTQLKLGADASEELARTARYEWLDGIREKYGASAVATAHHQDDVIETIILNMQRGTGWRGLCSLRETVTRKRPMLNLSKESIVSYAIERGLEWREDSTNDDVRYRRNYIRHGIMPKLDSAAKRKLIKLYVAQCQLRTTIDDAILQVQENVVTDLGVSRYWLIMMPENVAIELLKVVCDYRLLSRQYHQLLLFAKTARPGAVHEVGGVRVRAAVNHLIFER